MNILELDDTVAITSNDLAKKLGKRHDNVIRDIEFEISRWSMGFSKEDIEKHIKESTYLDKYERPQKNYILTQFGLKIMMFRYNSAASNGTYNIIKDK